VAIFATATSAQSVAGIRIAPFAPNATTFYVSSSNCPGPGTGSLADPFCTIQAGVDAASPGDTVSVSPGTYNENVTINKNDLTLDGTGAGTNPALHTILEGASPVNLGSQPGIAVLANVTGVTIKDLRVQNYASNSGIYGALTNNNFTVDSVHLFSNNTTNAANGGGLYMNGPVSDVLITNSEAQLNRSRGLVIWNGFKQDITITNNIVKNNNCCGIELQDGTASGVTITGNTVENNGDSGIAAIGLTSGAGANVIMTNTVRDNGRFGIEIKLPNGTGLSSGDGSIVVANNTVERTTLPGAEVRDLAGISVYRRGYVPGNNNVDIPVGVIVRNNTVTGYQQPSTSDGFGIVVEGLKMQVLNNTLLNNDVGVQRQAGHTPYAANTNTDGDQTNLADQYFGRGNSPQVCAAANGNTFTGNTTNARDVGPVSTNTVTNQNTGVVFCSIQAAIDDPGTLSGHTIVAGPGTYNENVTINKNDLTLQGAGAGTNPASHTILEGSTPVDKGSLPGISLPANVTGVTIKNLRVQNYASNSGIYGALTNDNFTVDSVHLFSNNTTNAVNGGGLYMNGPVSDVTITNSEVQLNRSRGLVIWNGFKQDITITNNIVKNNNCCGIELQDGTASGVTITGNTVENNGDSGIAAIGLTSGAGPNLISNNTLKDNGRFGIEIKLPNGTGAATGDGSIVVSDNAVTRTTLPGAEVRDLAGISVYRRGYVPGNNNVDIPTGVIVRDNTVKGYQQPSTSDGFGIVVEGLNMQVLNNTLESNDVGVQRQSGHTPYAANTSTDGDQSNLADQYFGRGNSPVVCASVQGNSFADNTVNMRDVGAQACADTPTPTTTSTSTGTATRTSTSTETPTSTSTATQTSTRTATRTTTSTSTGTSTSTTTSTSTASASSTRTATQTGTSTRTATGTITPLPTNTTTSASATAIATASATACPIQFADVPADQTFYTFIRCLACRGIVSGYPCGGPGEACNANDDPYYRPGANVTRGQLSKIIANSAGLDDTPAPEQQQFADVPPGSPFYEFVERLAQTGAIAGYPCGGPGVTEPCDAEDRPYFRPNNPATRGQISKIVSIAADFDEAVPEDQQTFTDVPTDSPFWVFIERLATRGIISGYGEASRCPETGAPCFRYNENTTRGQMAKIAANAFFPNCQTPARR
jgi:parallel beta-helix repeat protein